MPAAVIQYAERHKAHLGRLVLVDAVAYGHGAEDVAEDKEQEGDFARLAKDPHYVEALSHLKNDPFPSPDDAAMAQKLRDIIPLYFADPSKAPMLASSTEGTVPSSFAERTHAAAKRAEALDQGRKLGGLHTAVLVVQGSQDWIVPALVARHIHSHIAGSKLLMIENCGHFPWIEQPDIFFSGVAKFLSAPIQTSATRPR